jgi:RNA polymerase sigma-70 factor (ECF subfamily)
VTTRRQVSTPLCPKLIRIAYRMLGSVADAEDVVQEAFVRWLKTERAAIREPEAYLRRVVTRLCLDHLKSARRRRETYIGPWLPEPIVEQDDEADDFALPLMLALKRLSPLERAAFLLHDVFDVAFDEIAEIIGRESATCRQLASRAHAARPHFAVPKERSLEIAAAFFRVSRDGDIEQLRSLLASDVVAYADSGGKIPAIRPIVGLDEVMRLHVSLATIYAKTMSRICASASSMACRGS